MNVVLIMTDQQRAGLCAREGYPLDTNPCIDRLAAEGMWFNRAYTPVPACLPARVSMLTGRWPQATRVRHNSMKMSREHAEAARIPIAENDLFSLFRDAGYRTAMVGKNHSHLQPGDADYWSPYDHGGGTRQENRTPLEVEFDEFLAGLNHRAYSKATPYPLECQPPVRVVRDACNWIDTVGGDPFFMWLTFAEPHNPYQVPEPYFSMFPHDSLPDLGTTERDGYARGFKWRFTREIGKTAFPDYDEQREYARTNYHGMLRMIDDQVQRFIAHLESRGVVDDTLIVFMSDHGDFVGEYGLVRKGPGVPDVLMRVPLVFRGPGVTLHNGAHPAHVSLVDIAPTVCEAAGIMPDGKVPDGMQGRSLWPLLTGGRYPEEEFRSVYAEQGMGELHYDGSESIIKAEDDGLVASCGFDELNSRSQSGFLRMVRKGDWKLECDMHGEAALYNLGEDPYELKNLAGEPAHAEIEFELTKELLSWCIRATDTLPYPNLRYKIKRDPRNYYAPYRVSR